VLLPVALTLLPVISGRIGSKIRKGKKEAAWAWSHHHFLFEGNLIKALRVVGSLA